MVLHHPGGDLDALVLKADMDLQVEGLLANLTLVQRFRNTTDQWLAGSYLFPLPEDAAVRGLRMTIGERTIVADIQPRQEAQSAFDRAEQAGQIASLVEQQRPDLFTMKVANIAPRATIEVTLDVMLPVQLKAGQLSLTIPTTLTPRYLNAQSSQAQALRSEFVPSDAQSGPAMDVSLRIALMEDYSSVHSSTHTLYRDEQGLRIEDMPMNRDLKISWPVRHDTSTRFDAFVTQHDDARYVQILANPPELADRAIPPARELIIVVDKSGSMAGVSMRAAVEALNYAIDDLSPDDRLNIIAFDDQHYPLFQHSRVVTEAVRQAARHFANRLQADGGTEMESALSFALRDSATDNTDGSPENSAVDNTDNNAHRENTAVSDARLKQVVFITDGSVGYEDILLKSIRQQLGNSRLFTVGIGPAPNHWFLEKAAEAGRGVSVSIQDEYDVAEAISDMLNGLRYPVLTDIAVHYPTGHGELYPNPIPDLYADRPAMWVSKISHDVDEIVITGSQNEQRFRTTVALPAQNTADEVSALALSSSAPSVAMHWARRKISALEDEQRYSFNTDRHKQAITQLAMETGLVTQYTSLLAIESIPAREGDEPMSQQRVANRLPEGNRMMTIGMPRGAAGVDTLLWISLLLGSTGVALLGMSRRCW